jgi:hypothetical protein
LTAVILLVGAAAFVLLRDSFWPELEGTLRDRDGRETAYHLEILSLDAVENVYVREWVERNRANGEIDGKPVYYTLYNDELYEPMEFYLYMPSAKEVMGDVGMRNIRVEESGAALVLYIEAKDGVRRSKDGTDLILHVTVTDPEARAKTERFFVNGTQYACPGATFTRLR